MYSGSPGNWSRIPWDPRNTLWGTPGHAIVELVLLRCAQDPVYRFIICKHTHLHIQTNAISVL